MTDVFVQETDWLIQASKLKPSQYIRFKKGRIALPDIVAALEKQFPGPAPKKTTLRTRSRLQVTAHGSMITVFYPDLEGKIDIDACIWRQGE